LRQLREGIERWEKIQKQVSGREAFIVKRTLIEMRKDQYIIKNAYRQPIVFSKITRNTRGSIVLPWDEHIAYDNQGNATIQYSGISFCDPKVISEIL